MTHGESLGPGQGYVLPSSASESDRLERQAALYGGVEILEPFLADGPLRILDVGCGTGFFTRHVATRLPGSRVTGVDMDASRLAFASARCASPNATFERGDMLRLPFADGTFDLAYGRFVLCHLVDPMLALREMARVVRAGGRVVAYDMVHDGIWFSPVKPAFSRLLGEALRMMRERGMEPSQGLHLASTMIRAGLSDVTVQVIPHHALGGDPMFETYRRNWIETVAGLSEILGSRFDHGLVASALADLEPKGPEQLVVEVTVLASGRKPGTA
jgi:ubiquinone/menaquinone biosynthesis C-methylase UbiE